MAAFSSTFLRLTLSTQFFFISNKTSVTVPLLATFQLNDNGYFSSSFTLSFFQYFSILIANK